VAAVPERILREVLLVVSTRTRSRASPQERPPTPLRSLRKFHGDPEASHLLRPTAGTTTLLKNLGVPAQDAQIILGHSRLAVSLEIYTHEDRQAQREALGKISDVLRRDGQNGQQVTANWCQSRVSTACFMIQPGSFSQVDLRGQLSNPSAREQVDLVGDLIT